MLKSDMFVYEADKALFKYLRQREHREFRKRAGIVITVGRGGQVQFRWSKRESQFKRWSEVRITTYDSGELYLNASGIREAVLPTCEGVQEMAVQLLYETSRYDSFCRPDVLTYGVGRIKHIGPNVMTPFHQQAQAKRWQRHAMRLAYFTTTVEPPGWPYVRAPMSPEYLRQLSVFTQAIMREMIAEEDRRFLAAVNQILDKKD